MLNLDHLSLFDLITLASLKGQAGKPNVFEKLNIGEDRSNEAWLKKKVLEGVDKSLPLNESQVEEAIQLVITGQVKEDLASSLQKTLDTVRNIPIRLLGNPFSIVTSPLQTIAFPINAARNTAKTFLDPKNRTFRLALLAYARVNGVNITEGNIDDVFKVLDKPNAENLEELAKGGLETVKDQYGLNDLKDALDQFKSLTKTQKGLFANIAMPTT